MSGHRSFLGPLKWAFVMNWGDRAFSFVFVVLLAAILVGSGNSDAVPAAVFAASAAWVVTQALERLAIARAPKRVGFSS